MKNFLLIIALFSINAAYGMQEQTFETLKPKNIDSSMVLHSFEQQSQRIVSVMTGCQYIALSTNQQNFDSYHTELREEIDKLYQTHLLDKKMSSIVSRSPRYNTFIFKAQRVKNRLEELKNSEIAKDILTDTISGLLQSLQEAKERNKPKSKL